MKKKVLSFPVGLEVGQEYLNGESRIIFKIPSFLSQNKAIEIVRDYWETLFIENTKLEDKIGWPYDERKNTKKAKNKFNGKLPKHFGQAKERNKEIRRWYKNSPEPRTKKIRDISEHYGLSIQRTTTIIDSHQE